MHEEGVGESHLWNDVLPDIIELVYSEGKACVCSVVV